MRKKDELADPNSCFNKAYDDERLFVLLERDVAAPDAVREWIRRRVQLGKNRYGDDQISEAVRWIVAVEATRPWPDLPVPAGAQPLPAGKALDQLVAERVLGYRWMARVGAHLAWLFSPDSEDGLTVMDGRRIVERAGIVGPFQEYTDETKLPSEVPKFSTDIAAAYQVIDHLWLQGKRVRLWMATTYCCQFENDFDSWPVGCGDSVPVAICRAALAVVGA